jgi:hypothetical protein
MPTSILHIQIHVTSFCRHPRSGPGCRRACRTSCRSAARTRSALRVVWLCRRGETKSARGRTRKRSRKPSCAERLTSISAPGSSRPSRRHRGRSTKPKETVTKLVDDPGAFFSPGAQRRGTVHEGRRGGGGGASLKRSGRSGRSGRCACRPQALGRTWSAWVGIDGGVRARETRAKVKWECGRLLDRYVPQNYWFWCRWVGCVINSASQI